MDKKGYTLTFAKEHVVILVLAIVVIALGYMYIFNPNQLTNALTQGRTETGTEVAEIQNETQASTTITNMGTDIKALGTALDEIQNSIK